MMREGPDMTMHTPLNEFEINIARYKRLAREVTDPFAACLLEVVIEDLETGRLETGFEEGRRHDRMA
jgi:hypothetical protein